MTSVDNALSMVLERAQTRPAITRSSLEARCHVLAQDVTCTLDSPPHDKSLVDGYALRSSDLDQPGAKLRVLEEITAGLVPTQHVTEGTATRIMTGAPIPVGADTVVMIEYSQCERLADGSEIVRFQDAPARTGQNILYRGESMKQGQTVIRSGHFLRGIEIGLLAELGVSDIQVYPQPKVAILATGDELVSWNQQPAAGQIRNSNGPLLCGMTAEAGGVPLDLGIARDNESDLRRLIEKGLQCDVLILSGGVSAGVLDLVPSVLQQLGVKQVFHKIEMKPGKPLWFGVFEEKNRQPNLVFGLPGNPVSSLVCFYLFVRPAIARLMGRKHEPIERLTARLSKDFTSSGNRPTYFPGRVHQENGELFALPLAWRGSADLRTLTDANALLYFPAGSQSYLSGDPITIWLL